MTAVEVQPRISRAGAALGSVVVVGSAFGGGYAALTVASRLAPEDLSGVIPVIIAAAGGWVLGAALGVSLSPLPRARRTALAFLVLPLTTIAAPVIGSSVAIFGLQAVATAATLLVGPYLYLRSTPIAAVAVRHGSDA